MIFFFLGISPPRPFPIRNPSGHHQGGTDGTSPDRTSRKKIESMG